jgi:excisionase family DNA binding protein
MGRIDAPVAPLLYSVPQVAQALAMSRAGVYELLRDGRLPSRYLGSRRYVPADALHAFVDALPDTPGGP